ncbi:rhomboid family intramembrane serine protease [Candidatus Roizmanbacteria bacterium]|nr:rhomboid family intramembrane serine protease [Candidatus Roizmanbacteria bacterium]
MFPLRDTRPTRTFPFVNYLIIGITIYAFFLQLSAPDFDKFLLDYAFIPTRFNFFDVDSYKYILYSIFLHGGIFHIASNLWFLHIFGDNVEDSLGHIRYLIFYLLAGTAAVFAQYIFSVDSTIPMIGASGAISGVTGAYFVLVRNSKIEALVILGFFIQRINLSSTFFLGYWFFIQLFSGIGSVSTIDPQMGGVAYFAHIGGFLFGYLFAKQIDRGRIVEYLSPNEDRLL